MIAVAIERLMGIAAAVPVTPDRDEGQKWIVEELSKPEYQAAKPSWFDRLSKGFWDWLSSLNIGGAGGAQVPFIAILVVVIVGVIVAAFFIFGKPRVNRRSAIIGSLFGEDEHRNAAALRRAASEAAAQKNWTLAIEEIFRALARALAERVLVSTDPGTTAHGFAQRAGAAFPAQAARLAASATVFDGVRYLDKPGLEAEYNTLAQLEAELRSLSPSVATPMPFAGVR